MSGHADTIRRAFEGTLEDPRGEVASALDALLAENQRLREALTLILDTVPMHLYPWEKAREALAGDTE